MNEAERQRRNADKLSECFPAFRPRLKRVLETLEAQGFRPRIQEAWRSIADQMAAFNKGTSKTKFGFHNVTGPGGAKEALASDVLDDDKPLAPPTRYLLALALAARAQGLETGILWGLPSTLASGVTAAISARNIGARVKVGWDPTHVQVAGLSSSAARAGARPTFKAGQARPKPSGAVRKPAAGPAQQYIVQRGDNLGKIAKVHGITLARILELNPQFRANPNLIRVGERVRVK